MTIDFEDYNGYFIATMIADEFPHLMDYITIKTSHHEFSGRVINIEKEYKTTENSIKAIVRIDYIIPR
jgi:hypothetical protein